ncbi:MAG: TonB-dependent receptor [Bacteroidota bacterium]
MHRKSYEEYSFKGGIGIVSSRFMAEGPIVKDKTSFLVGARASYSDWVLDLVQDPLIQESGATFSDINVILSHRFNLKHSLTFSYYGSTDDFQYAQDFGFNYSTQLAGVRWNGILGSNFSTSSTFNYGDYDSRSFIPEGVDAFNLDNGIEYYQFKQNFFWLPQGHKINFGLEVNGNRMKPDVLTPRGEGSTILPDRAVRDKSRDFALYFNDEYTLSERISVSAGLRYSHYQQLGDDAIFIYDEEGLRRVNNITDTIQYGSGEVIQTYGGLEPRFSLRLGLDDSGDKGSIKMSYNRTRQYIHLISNSAAPTPVDIWQVSNPYIEPQIGDNFSIGYFKNFNSNVWESFVELYYKNIDNLVDFRDFPDLFLNEHLETELLSGQGRAYGLEFYLRRLAGRWTGWLSYTYSRSEIQIPAQGLESAINNGEWYPTNFDQPHTVNLVAKRQLGKRSALSFNFTYQTGRPITGLVSSYAQNNSPIPNFSERNAYRVPDYVRFDVSMTIAGRTWPGKKFNSNLTLSAYNLFGRRNAFSVFYQRPEGALIPRAFQLSVLGAVFPAVTYNFSF